MATFKDFRNSVKPNWCPGCGDFSVQAAIQRAAANVGYEPSELAVISGSAVQVVFLAILTHTVSTAFTVVHYRSRKALKWRTKT